MALTAERIKLAEFSRNIFAISPEPNVKLADMLQPAFWSHVAAKLHPSDRIEVIAEDSTYFAELYVVSCGRNWAKVSVLRMHELTEDRPQNAGEPTTSAEVPTADAAHIVQWVGGQEKARVLRLVDKAVIKSGFATKKDAAEWLDKYEAELAVVK